MSRTVTLPSGHTAVLRDPEDLSFGEREDVLGMFNSIDLNGKLVGAAGKALVEFQRAIIALGVQSWDFFLPDGSTPLPIPSTDPDGLRTLTARDGGFLFNQLQGLSKELFDDFDVNPDPESPTQP